jgi:fructokinase
VLQAGLDIGGTKIAAVVLDSTGRECGRWRQPTQKSSYEQFLESVSQLVNTLRQQLAEPFSLGIALPGSVSPVSGRIRNANILVLNGQPLAQDLATRLGQPVTLANDANCFALSEARDGAGAGYSSVFGMTLGTGCGGGLVFNNQLIIGGYGSAAECGHIPLPGYQPENDGPAVRCYCGQENCAESFVSGTGLARGYHLLAGEEVCGEQVISRAQAGDAAALQQVARFRSQLSRLLATIINVVDPAVIVLGGGLSQSPLLLEGVAQQVAPRVFTDHFQTPIVTAQHGASSGMRGAAWLGAEQGVR